MNDILSNSTYVEDIKRVLKKLDLKQLNGKRLLITGGLGLLGSSIVDLLICYGKIQKIYILARNQEQFDIRYGGVEKVKWIPYDALEPFTFPYDADYVIHCAGITNPALYVSAPVETMLSNVYGVMELLEYSKKHKVKKFMYISSS